MEEIVNKYLSHITIIDGVVFDVNKIEVNGYDLSQSLMNNFSISEEEAQDYIQKYLMENHGFNKEIFEDFFIPFPPPAIKDYLGKLIEALREKNETEDEEDDI